MPKRHILVVEDDNNIRQGLVDALESEGYATSQAPDGERALQLAGAGGIDLILLDIMMPEKSGYEVCRELRKSGSQVPVIMLTAKGEEIDKVVGLQLGADDYVTKPFGVHELLARVDAVLRRCTAAKPVGDGKPEQELPDKYHFGATEIDRRRYLARRGRKEYDLTAREIKLLDVFYTHPGEVLSRDELLNRVWGINYYGTTRTLDQHIAQLRKKVEKSPANPVLLVTVHGVGYRYMPDEEWAESDPAHIKSILRESVNDNGDEKG